MIITFRAFANLYNTLTEKNLSVAARIITIESVFADGSCRRYVARKRIIEKKAREKKKEEKKKNSFVSFRIEFRLSNI